MGKNISIIIGSLRKASINRMIANHIVKNSNSENNYQIVEIDELDMYNEDKDKNPPEAWTTFRNTIKQSDGFLFITPEYNRGLPAAMKNALDVGSRPYGHNAWEHKPGAVISGSMGAIAGFGANHQLRQTCVFLNILMMQQPEAYIGSFHKLFDEDGNLTNENTKSFLTQFIQSFDAWIEKCS